MSEEQPPSPSSALIVGRPDGSPIGIYAAYYEYGFGAANKQGSSKSDEAVMNQLVAFAESSAKVLSAAPFDPATNPADARLDAERQHQLARRTEFEQQVNHARTELKLMERARDDQGKAPEEPQTPYFIGLLGTAGVSATVTLMLNDVIFAKTLGDPAKALTASALFGLLLAAGISTGILGSAKHQGTSWTHVMWITLGLIFGVGLLVLRLGPATTPGDERLAYGFAILEVVALVVLELFTYGLRRAWQSFREQSASYGVVSERVETAKRYLSTRQTELSQCEKKIAQLDEEVKVRTNLVLANPLVCATARETVLRGYQDGLAANYGYLNGNAQSAPQPPSRAEVIAKLGALPSVAALMGRLSQTTK